MSNLSQRKLKIFFHPVDAVGHYNACIGLAQELQSRGHRISFLNDHSLKGEFVKFGFEEIHLNPKDDSDKSTKVEEIDGHQNDHHPLDNMADLLKIMIETGLLSNRTSMEKCKLFDRHQFFEELVDKTMVYNGQIERLIKEKKPDLIVVDNFMVEPAIMRANIPWIYLHSAAPISMYRSNELPPFSSGYPTYGSRELWPEFQRCIEQYFYVQSVERQNRLLNHFGYPELKDETIILSPYLNLYQYPQELDYQDAAPRPANFVVVDAFCREMPETFQLPKEFRNKIKPGDKLIYVSLGSMGSFNVELMNRMMRILSKTKHKYIVSKGQLPEQIKLNEDNMWGEAFVAQTDILPLVDLVITHGGNNTVTETFNFGKPMIVMPLFGDQFDNAQRVHEKGFGIRLDTHEYTEQELIESIDRLLNDTKMNQQLREISKRIQQSNLKEKAAIAIEQMVNANLKK